MQAKGSRANLPAMRLLIVEDEPDLLRALSRALREDGYAVDTAEDGEDARFKALECDYDAIVLDWMLPVMSGLEVLKALRAKKQTPVLMLTAKTAVQSRIEGLNSGADDYLAKPFDINELRARLRALIRRSGGQARDQIVIGEVTVDTWAKSVKLAGELVVLTAREFALVEYLAMRRGKMVSRTELYEHLFDENEDSLSNLLDVRVSLVRKKLGAEFIVTRRGQGYCIP
jgi:two-component system OmpR family response regulator